MNTTKNLKITIMSNHNFYKIIAAANVCDDNLLGSLGGP